MAAATEHIMTALLEAQKNIGAATKDSINPFFKSNYADLGSVMSVVKGPLNNAGLAITQELEVHTTTPTTDGVSPHSYNVLNTTLWHTASKETLTSQVVIPSNNDIQKWGAGLTYMKRYQLQSLLFVPTEDNDGEDVVDRAKPKRRKAGTQKAGTVSLNDVPF